MNGIAYVDFSIDHGMLTIDRIAINRNSTLEISRYNSKTKLYEGTLSDFKSIELENGDYLVAITDFSDTTVKFYYGIMTADSRGIYLSMDSNEAAIESFHNQSVSPMATGTQYESEPDNAMSQAMTIYNNNDVYGRIYDSSDSDWYRVQFSSSGRANFWLGNIPSGENFNLGVYNSSGTLLGRSESTSSQELITLDVSANTWYYIKVYGVGGSWSVSNYLLRAKLNNPYGNMGWQYMYNSTGPFKKISSGYGPRSAGAHCGFDITSETGTSIKGAVIANVYGGTCIEKGYNKEEGYFVRIRTNSIDPATGNHLVVHYKHMKSTSPLKVNRSVAKGAKVGNTGATGNATGPHLHFQANKIGVGTYNYASTVNPILFFPNVKFSGDTSMYPNSVSISEILYDTFYYSIPGFVIEYIGEEKFNNWIDSVATVPGAVTIRNALEYFMIDKETFQRIATPTKEDLIYDPDVLYLGNAGLNNIEVIQKFLDEKNSLREKSKQ